MISLRILLLVLSISRDVLGYRWSVKTPSSITGAEGSCVVIPCTYSYPGNSPLKTRMWLQGDKTDGTLVINSRGNSDTRYQNRTHFLNTIKGDCTLKINNLKRGDEGTYYFRMELNDKHKYSEPNGVTISISDVPRFTIASSPEEIRDGLEVTLTCSVQYSCPGLLGWSGSEALNRSSSSEVAGSAENGWYSSVMLTFVASFKDHGRTLSCGSLSEQQESHSKRFTLNVNYAPKVVYITSSPTAPIRARVPVTLKCGVLSSNPPVTQYRWIRYHQSYAGGLLSSTDLSYNREETLWIHSVPPYSFYKCKAMNAVGTTSSDTIALEILSDNQWGVWAPLALKALEGSCVTIPCLFRTKGALNTDPRTGARKSIGIWLKNDNYDGDQVYHTHEGSNTDFTGRLEFLGSMDSGNCSLRIKNLKLTDSGRYYFRMEIAGHKWSGKTGVKLMVSENPEKPEIKPPGNVEEGKETTLSCSVESYCPEDTPALEWNSPYSSVQSDTHQSYRDNVWIYSRDVTFTPTFEGSNQALRCNAVFGHNTKSADSEVHLNVRYRPRNTSVSLEASRSDVGHRMKEGDSVTMTCRALSSNPAVNGYRWYKDGKATHGRGQTLRFQAISYEDFGEYHCIASNEIGSGSPSETLTVTGQYKPRKFHISYRVNGKEVSDLTGIKERDDVKVTCVSNSSDPQVTNYGWYWDYGYTKSTDQILLFTHITKQDKGRYYCQARNQVGTGQSETISIDITYSPTNVRIDFWGAARAEEYVTLRCESDAYPVANSYSWRRDCNGMNTTLSGTSIELRFRVSVRDASCHYYCTAINPIGKRESSNKVIDVQYKPRNVKILSSDTVKEGMLVTLTCDNDANPHAHVYSWVKSCGPAYKILGSSPSVGITISSEDEHCDYYCTAKNTIGEQRSQSKRFVVLYSPKNTQVQSLMRPLQEGNRVTLTCNSKSSPLPQYTWYKSKVNIKTTVGQTLSLGPLNRKDSGDYYCKATNTIGSETSKAIWIDVLYAPGDTEVSISPPKDVIKEGDNITLTCSSDGKPAINEYKWTLERRDMTITLPATGKDLRLYTVTGEQDGLYFCEAQNSIGSHRSKGRRIKVVDSHIKLIIIILAVILAVVMVIILVILIIRKRNAKANSLHQDDTPATNTVYSMVIKRNKPRETEVYENMVMTDCMETNSHTRGVDPPVEGIEYASINFAQGPRDRDRLQHKQPARSTVKKSPKANHDADANAIYSLVQKAELPSKQLANDDYENVSHLYSNDDDGSEDEVNYTSVVHLNLPRNRLQRRISEDSIDYTDIRF